MTTFFGELSPSELHSASYLNKFFDSQPVDDGHVEGARITLIAQALTPYIVNQIINEFSDLFNVTSVTPHRLHTTYGDAVVVLSGTVTSANKTIISERIDTLSKKYHIDLGLQEHQPKLAIPGLLVMDMDSTVVSIECIDEIAKLAGVGEQVSAVTEKAMRGEIAFNESLAHRVACLRGVPKKQLEQIRDSIPLMPGIQQLIASLQQHGWKLAIASGGFTYFADHLKQRLGLDEAVSNTLGIYKGKLTGEVTGKVVNADVKADTVKLLAKRWNIPSSQTVAMGDGANDLMMMAESSLGVACHAKPVVNQKADVAIRYSGLHSMLYYLG